jgi:hypothetical protein
VPVLRQPAGYCGDLFPSSGGHINCNIQHHQQTCPLVLLLGITARSPSPTGFRLLGTLERATPNSNSSSNAQQQYAMLHHVRISSSSSLSRKRVEPDRWYSGCSRWQQRAIRFALMYSLYSPSVTVH